jgi:Flp pilus assembly protein TadG
VTVPAFLRRRRHDDRGQVAGVEAVAFGVLIFVAGSLLIVNVWAFVDARLAVDVAAREATRAYVEGANGAEAQRHAETAAKDALAGYGRSAGFLDVTVRTDQGPAAFSRCSPITVTVRYRLPAVTAPVLGTLGDGVVVTGTHTEVVDPLRNGIDGELAGCGP